MESDLFDIESQLAELQAKTITSESEIAEIKARLLALSARTMPPIWGYIGMLINAAEHGFLLSYDSIDSQILSWELRPAMAEGSFQTWNKERLANE
jgi:hypothetical protein